MVACKHVVFLRYRLHTRAVQQAGWMPWNHVSRSHGRYGFHSDGSMHLPVFCKVLAVILHHKVDSSAVVLTAEPLRTPHGTLVIPGTVN